MRKTVLKPAHLLADLLLFLVVLVVSSAPISHVSAQNFLPARAATELPPFIVDLASWTCVASADTQYISFGSDRKNERAVVSYIVKASVVYKDPEVHPAWSRTLDVKKDIKSAAAMCADWSSGIEKQVKILRKERS